MLLHDPKSANFNVCPVLSMSMFSGYMQVQDGKKRKKLGNLNSNDSFLPNKTEDVP